jgi:DTW domain-containing protein YfiP
MGRTYCEGCNKPESVCLCAYISRQENTFPVLILQHDDEHKKPLSTVPLIERGLSRTQVLRGVEFDKASCFRSLDKLSVRHPILLYPDLSRRSKKQVHIDLEQVTGDEHGSLEFYDSLIVLDGTWRNTREIVLVNSWLTDLPILSLKNVSASNYRIRKSENEESLSTIEAVSSVLSFVESGFDVERFLLPFERMIDHQIRHMGDEVYRRNYC